LTARHEALADGVFAIVMTLLVFELAPPKDRMSSGLEQALSDLGPSFVAYAISVGLVGIYWSAHHAMFLVIERTDLALNWLNLLFLAVVSLVPFSTRLLALHGSHPLAIAIYGANLGLVGLALLTLWSHATHDHRLIPESTLSGMVAYGRSRCLVGVVGYGLATALAWVDPRISLGMFALVPLLYILPPIQGVWSRAFGIDKWPGRDG
jgi:uncharacterized membrane protein